MPNSPQTAFRDEFDPRDFLGRAGAGKVIEKYEKGRKVFSQGEDADAVFFIQKGKIKITVLSEHGKEAVVGIFAEGQFFGEACLDGAAVRTATSEAMEEIPDHFHQQSGYACDAKLRAEVFCIFHDLSVVPKQPDRRRSDRPAL